MDNLDPALQECMQYGVVAYCVPHSVWEHGHPQNDGGPDRVSGPPRLN